jgi:hypothetical protein
LRPAFNLGEIEFDRNSAATILSCKTARTSRLSSAIHPFPHFLSHSVTNGNHLVGQRSLPPSGESPNGGQLAAISFVIQTLLKENTMTKKRYRPKVERLEQRQLLTANVWFAESGQELAPNGF